MANAVELEMSAWAQAVDSLVQAVEQRWQVFTVLAMLNLLDVVTTVVVLDSGGSERNPFVQPVVHNLMHLVMLKGFVLAVVAALLMRCRESHIVDLALTGAAGWYLAVVSWNLAVLVFV